MTQQSKHQHIRPLRSRNGKRSGSRGIIAHYNRAWRKAPLMKRIRMTATIIIAAAAAIALIVAVIHIVDWRMRVKAAQADQEALALAYDFDPGNIISDGQFFNGSAMSEAQVQSFLNEQGGALASRTFDTQDESGESLCADYTGAKKESAAAIIAKSGEACRVSQKVLLTMLQKEQHLVTATQPTDFQLKAAMGLSCPDDANCDPAYAGFFRQVYGAAKRYRYYLEHESRYGYHAGQLNYIQYHPDAACGGTDVYIENKATALLYIYTPYQPNRAALEAATGEGDSCSSYGNRNFAFIYTNWFGSPRN